MGNNNTSISKEERQKSLKNLLQGTPTRWKADAALGEWARLNEISEDVINVLVTKKIDGECVTASSKEILQEWLTKGTPSLSQAQFVKLYSLLESQLVNHNFVVAMKKEPNIDHKFNPDDHQPPHQDINQQTANEVINEYHNYSKNSTTGGAPTLKRVWEFQPKDSRRYYGAHVEDLIPVVNIPSLAHILYYSMSVNVFQTKEQEVTCIRSPNSKRVNPSR